MIKDFRFKKNQTLAGYILNEIGEYANDLMSNEFRDVFKETPINIYMSNSLADFRFKELSVKGRLNKKHLLKAVDEISQRNDGVSMMAFHAMDNVDGKAQLVYAWIRLMSENIYYEILVNLENIDLTIEYLKMSMRHEIGHIIDFLKMDGIPFEEYDRITDTDSKEMEKFYDKWGYNTHNLTKEQAHQRTRDYYACPSEARANKNVNFDLDKYIDIMDGLSYDKKDFQIDMTIKSKVKTFDKKEEE